MSIFLAVVNFLKGAPWQIWAILAAVGLLVAVWASGVSQGRSIEKRAQEAAIERIQAEWEDKYARLEDERDRLATDLTLARGNVQTVIREVVRDNPVIVRGECKIDFGTVEVLNKAARGG